MTRIKTTDVHRTGPFVAALFLAISLFAPQQSLAQAQTITIGTGGTAGVYYPLGQALCKGLNIRQAKYAIHCEAPSTQGSVDNAKNIHNGTIDFGVVQSDIQYYALKGFGPFKSVGPDQALRAVVSFHAEPFTVVARADAGIKTFDDLKGKRVNIGNPGSGQRTTMDLVMHDMGWSKADFAKVTELTSPEQSAALCADEIDAMVFSVGHPNESIKDVTETCPAVLIDVTGPAIERLIKRHPYYDAVIIPAKTYKGTPGRTLTFGVRATLVTSSDTPDTVVTSVLDSLFDSFGFTDFKFSHPALQNLVIDDMIKKGHTAPLHPAALRFYQKGGEFRHVRPVSPAPKRR